MKRDKLLDIEGLCLYRLWPETTSEMTLRPYEVEFPDAATPAIEVFRYNSLEEAIHEIVRYEMNINNYYDTESLDPKLVEVLKKVNEEWTCFDLKLAESIYLMLELVLTQIVDTNRNA